MKQATLTCAMAILGLVACNKGSSGGAAASASASTAPVATPSSSAATMPSAAASAPAPGASTGGDGPSLKEGLWSIHSQTTDLPENKKREGNETLCRNHAYDTYARGLSKSTKCRTIAETFAGGVLNTEAECTVAGSVIRTKSTATIADTVSHSETHSTYTPAAYGVAESTMIMDEKYIGSCPAGTEPGDMMRADGTVMKRWKH